MDFSGRSIINYRFRRLLCNHKLIGMNIEQYYDNMYEKSIQDTYPEDCEKCNGTGKIWISDCCGSVVENSNCTDCGQLCTEVSEQCETCKGVGEILEEES